VRDFTGVPNRIRTGVAAVKGRQPTFHGISKIKKIVGIYGFIALVYFIAFHYISFFGRHMDVKWGQYGYI